MKGLLYLELNGEKKGLQFGMYAIKLLTEKRGISLNEIGDLFNGIDEDPIKSFDLMVDLVFAGISNYNLINDIKEELNYFRLYNDFGSVDKDQYESIFKAFLETQISGKALASNNDLDKAPKDVAKKK
ncbi:MAG: hypothetical protein EOO43_04150 [Flavobacterium sp.]|nr:MAG: hypothetical protein EOO43_04150 [Flavobacterium sp.]